LVAFPSFWGLAVDCPDAVDRRGGEDVGGLLGSSVKGRRLPVVGLLLVTGLVRFECDAGELGSDAGAGTAKDSAFLFNPSRATVSLSLVLVVVGFFIEL
jgi:hypothetical protein